MNKLDIIMRSSSSDTLKELMRQFLAKKEMYVAESGTNKQVFWFSDTDFSGLLSQIIKELESYIGPFGDSIANFESLYGTSSYAYVTRKKEEYKKAHNNKEPQFNLGIERDLQKKIWEAKAKQSEYYSRYGIVKFIEEIEDILQEIMKNKDNYTLEVSDAIRRLVSKSSGVERVDKDNLKLLSLYEEKLEKDRELLKKKKSNEFEGTIDRLRKSDLYANKNHVGDSQHIGNKDSMTFGRLFDELRYLFSKTNFSIKTVNPTNIDLNISENGYIERIEKLGKTVKNLESNHNRSVKEKDNYVYTIEEEEELRKLGENISDKLLKVIKIYKQLEEKKEKFRKMLMYIDAVKVRLDAINETITVLESNKKDGNTTVFPNTLEMLSVERDKCYAIIEKHKDTIKLFDSLFDEVSVMINIIDSMNNSYDVIINHGRERQSIEDAEKRQTKLVNEQRLEALREQNNKEIIEQVKREVIEQMTKEGYKPRPYNYDGEKYQEDYTEFNKIFKERLRMALIEKGINYSESDLGNPYDTSISKELPKLEKEGMGMYHITEDNYALLYDLFKEDFDNKGIDYEYDDVLDSIKKYIDDYFGLDNISNKDELKEIIKNHKKSTMGNRSL